MKDIFKIKRLEKGTSVIDGAGVKINRIIASNRLNYIDPFVLLDEIRSDNPSDYIAGFPTHPHRGIETITYMKHGKFRHKDSRGGGGLLTDGCVQWMTAGKGILHSEMPEKTDGQLWGYQLWLSLPAKDKMTEPRYQHLSPDMISSVEHNGANVKVISGSFLNARGPAENILDSDYFDVSLSNDAYFERELLPGKNTFIYVHSGSVTIGSEKNFQDIGHLTLAELPSGFYVKVTTNTPSAGFLFLSAAPNNEPIVRGGPFVMNTKEEIRQAFEDYERGILF